MKASFGLKAHSGWAALVVVGTDNGKLHVLDRRRLELVEESNASWAKQPYHAAEKLRPSEARKIVSRGIQAARRIATREMRLAVKRIRRQGHTITGCALLVGEQMPDWTVDEILAVHFRMHKAEGVFFREALAEAAGQSELKLLMVPEKSLLQQAQSVLKTRASEISNTIASLGKSAGPPWGKDQKEAALAAIMALNGNAKLIAR